MEKAELQESEAYSYRNRDDDDTDDSTVDPDISLAYIDEKLQYVLGHFQKDFEGGVSAENLGAKFGGYGSFLPTYQRSPVRQCPQTSQKNHLSNTSRIQNNPQLEGVQTNLVVPSSASLLPSRGSTFSTVASTNTLKDSANDFPKRNERLPPAQCADVSSSGYEHDKNFPHASERSLGVRIKVGSDDLSTEKNADIYSGFGLDISPSMSADGSPVDSDGFREPFNPAEDSPTSILQTMISFPVHGNLLLSPLPCDLIYLSEKQKFQGESKDRTSQQTSNAKHSARVKGGIKHKSSRKNDFPVERNNHVNKDSHNGNGLFLKKEKHVHLADGHVEDSEIGSKVKRECSSDIVKRETLEAGSTRSIGLVDLPSGIFAMGFAEKVNSTDDLSIYPRKDDYLKGNIAGASTNADSDVSFGKKAQSTELVDRLEVNPTFLEEEYLASRSKKKSKGSRKQVVHGGEVAKESSSMDASLEPTERKSKHIDIVLPKSEVEYYKPQKDLGKVRDTYRDFFGDVELEQDDDVDSEDMVSNDRQGQFKAVQKSASEVASKENSLGKRGEKSSIPKENPKAAPTEDPTIGFRPISDAVVGTGALDPLVKEDWVCCDKCQKWRLLPLGTNPDNLPEKWLCSMLDWLPGMNRCSFSEEETTKALVASHQLSAPSSGSLGPNLIDASVFNGKKTNRIKDVAASANRDDPISNSMKNNLQASDRGCGLNNVNQSPLVTETETRQLSKSSALEKHRHKKVNKKLHEHHLGRGEISRKRDLEPGLPCVSKKTKADDDWMSDHDRPSGKGGTTSSSGLPLIAGGKNRHKNNDHHSRNKKRDAGNRSKDPSANSLHQSTERKRKMSHSPLYRRSDLLEAASENDDRKEKKARVSKSVVGEDTIGNKGLGGSKKRTSMKEQQFGTVLGMESMKRDLRSAQPSQATSSSSKVSGSHHKAAFSKEVKGSPVESVSSSPLRFLNEDKATSVRNFDGKDDFGDAALFITGSPRTGGADRDEGGSDGPGRARKDESIVNGRVGSSVLEVEGSDTGHLSVRKAKMLPLSEVPNCHFVDDVTEIVHTGNQYPHKPQSLDQLDNKGQRNENQLHANVFRLHKFEKGSLSSSKSKNGNSQVQRDPDELQISNSCNGSVDRAPDDEKRKALKNSVKEQVAIGRNMVQQFLHIGKDESKIVADKGKKDGKFIYSVNNRLDKVDGSRLDQKQNMQPERDDISSHKLLSQELPSSGRGQSYTGTGALQLVTGVQKENESKSSVTDGTIADDTLKATKLTRRPEKQSGNQPSKSAHLTCYDHKINDLDASSPVRRDSSSQAGNSAVKEAKDLKHLADRLKNSGSNAESTSLYFQAALKFLHGASLLESCNSESAKKGEIIVAMQVYSSTAKLCEFCAREYDKHKDFAAAALAYKLMEVAYMRVIYSSNTNASKDRHELQTALQMIPLGESPSSSASDIDNINNPSTIDKAHLVNGVGSPQVIGNHNIATRNRPSLARMLNFAQDVNYAMEASRKSRTAFAAARSRAKECYSREGITSVKKALDFNFHDVERLLKLVRLAMDAISH